MTHGISAQGCSRTGISVRPARSLRGLPASPRLTPARSRPPPEVAGARGDRGAHQETASWHCVRRRELQPATAPSARPAPRGPTRRHRLLRPTAPVVTVAASELQTPVTPHKNNLLAGVCSREVAAGAAPRGMPGLGVSTEPPANQLRGKKLRFPKIHAARRQEAAGSWAGRPRIPTTSGLPRLQPVVMETG